MNKNKYSLIISLGLLSITVITGTVLMSSYVLADDSVVDDVNINVPVSCSLEGTGMNSHNASVVNGTYQADIGTTTMKAFCNDTNGFAIYVIGYTDNEYGKTVLTNSTLGSSADITTGTATSGNTSNWAMKLATNTSATYPLTLDNGFGSYSAVPSTYTKVVHRDSGTDIGTNATGATLTSTYAAFMSQTQAAGTYTGQVKYTLVHPSNADAPITPPAPTATCNTPVPNITYMQDITSSNKATVLSSLTPGKAYYLRDNRDEEPYCVSKLADGNLWMLDNLRLGGSTTIALTPSDTNIASNYTLPASSTGNFYTTNGYTTAGVYTGDKNTITTSYGNGSGKIGVYYNYCAVSAGTYCYASGSGTGNVEHDICPKGWRMPTGGSSGEYQALYAAYSSDATNFRNALSTPLSGYFNYGATDAQSFRGYFLSSTYYDSGSMYYLYVDPSEVSFTGHGTRLTGSPLRCLLGS